MINGLSAEAVGVVREDIICAEITALKMGMVEIKAMLLAMQQGRPLTSVSGTHLIILEQSVGELN